MVQSADLMDLNDPASLQSLNGSGFRCILIQRQMRPRPMVITEVTFQNPTQVPLVDHDHVVQAFSANTPDYPFRIAVLPRTPGRYRNLSDTQSIHSCPEIMAVDPIAIPYQIVRRGIVRKWLHDLLCRPCSGRVFRNIEMQHTSTVMGKDDKLG
jgi:hypothetical protein